MTLLRLRARLRGQALVLFALTLLLLTLLVTLTIGLGVRVREKMELQHVTDAAAYSNAVATARALNAVALLNRAEVAVDITILGTQSLISWTSMYMAGLNTMETQLTAQMALQCAAPSAACTQVCARATALLEAIATRREELQTTVYNAGGLDAQAGDQARTQQSLATTFRDMQEEVFVTGLVNQLLTNQNLTRSIVREAARGSRWEDEYVVSEESAVTLREVRVDNNSLAGTTDAEAFALNPRNVSREIGVQAAMGARGDPFLVVRSDSGLGGKLQQDLDALAGPGGTVVTTVDMTLTGSGRFAGETPGQHATLTPAPTGAVGDDEGELTVSLTDSDTGCNLTTSGEAWAYVWSSDTTQNDDTHQWSAGVDPDVDPGVDPDDGADGAAHRHTLGDCTNCPGIWTMFIDLNPNQVSNQVEHLNGQPKNFAVVQRDYRARCDTAAGPDCSRADPWNLLFRFQLGPGVEGDFDNRGLVTHGPGAADISRQTTLAAGLAYYHRRDHWREPPNFFNPFWRATLVAPTVDDQGLQDIETTLAAQPGAAAAADSFRALRAAGFEGWQ